VKPGESYRFRYLAEGGVWFDDPSVQVREAQDAVVRGLSSGQSACPPVIARRPPPRASSRAGREVAGRRR
jgi:hypothetical protein